MSSIVAKKYALALVAVSSESEINEITTYLDGVSALFSDSKFVDIIKSPLVTRDEKVSVIIESLKEAPEKFVNFIKILSNGDRLLTIPFVLEELAIIKASKENSYTGFVESDTDFSAEKINELKNALSKKLGISLELETRKDDYDGIKVEIPDMGLRVDFSQSHIKDAMLAHILKAI